jgi:hypothetical protein
MSWWRPQTLKVAGMITCCTISVSYLCNVVTRESILRLLYFYFLSGFPRPLPRPLLFFFTSLAPFVACCSALSSSRSHVRVSAFASTLITPAFILHTGARNWRSSPPYISIRPVHHTAYHYEYIAIGLQAEEMWDDQGRDGTNSFRFLEVERTSWPKPWSYWWLMMRIRSPCNKLNGNGHDCILRNQDRYVTQVTWVT